MNLSDAILKGCEIRPNKTRCTLWGITKEHFGLGFRTTSCVLGAAYDGTFGPVQIEYDSQYSILKVNGQQDTSMMMAELREAYPILGEIAFPNDYKDVRPVECVITSFNDDLICGHRDTWTREQIAAWV